MGERASEPLFASVVGEHGFFYLQTDVADNTEPTETSDPQFVEHIATPDPEQFTAGPGAIYGCLLTRLITVSNTIRPQMK